MSPRILPGDPTSGLLIIVDHASNHVPADIALGIDPALLGQHMAIDIGTEALCEALAEHLSSAALLATVSRLVIDLNREEDAPGLIPHASDGHPIPGNASLTAADRLARIDRFWRPYHEAIDRAVAEHRPDMLVSLHSFTPRLSSDPQQRRPWQIGVLYNQDERAARIAIPLLRRAGIETGDNLPYSGKLLNATMNRHGEGRGMPYLGLEVRQDLIADPGGVVRWAALLAPVIAATRNSLAQSVPLRS